MLLLTYCFIYCCQPVVDRLGQNGHNGLCLPSRTLYGHHGAIRQTMYGRTRSRTQGGLLLDAQWPIGLQSWLVGHLLEDQGRSASEHGRSATSLNTQGRSASEHGRSAIATDDPWSVGHVVGIDIRLRIIYHF